MNVLSLFDGLGCSWIVLKELGIHINKGYSSEIDKHCCKQIALNFPEVEQIGDVRQIDVSKLEKIDFLFGGSPCQDFSFIGSRRGMVTKTKEQITTLERYIELKEEGFAFEGQSYLFFEFLRILRDIRAYNPNVKFLLENVEVGKKWEYVFNENLGLHGVHINSALVSAQNRRRIYWTNIKTKTIGLYDDVYTDIPQPEDRGIFLRDILENEVDEKYYVSQDVLNRMNRENYSRPSINPDKTDTLNTKNNSGSMSLDSGTTFVSGVVFDRGDIRFLNSGKSNCIDAHYYCFPDNHGQRTGVIIQRERGNNKGGVFKDKTPTLSACSWEQNNLLCKKMVIQLNPSTDSGGTQPYQQDRVYDINGISPALLADMSSGTHAILSDRIRRLTPTECARLQTIPDWYRWEYIDKNIKLCELNVKLKNVIDSYQIEKQDCVIYTIFGLSEQELQMSVSEWINRRNVLLKNAIECAKPIWDCALNTIKDLKDSGQQNFKKKVKNIRPTVLYVENVSMEEMGRQKDIALYTIEVLEFMGMHVKLIKDTKKGSFILGVTDICQEKMGKQSIERYMRITLEGNYLRMNVHIILILTRLIIELKIYTYSKVKLSTKVAILNLKELPQNSLNLVLSDLKMGIIKKTSERQQYKMLGNGWTIEVIKHILSFNDGK